MMTLCQQKGDCQRRERWHMTRRIKTGCSAPSGKDAWSSLRLHGFDLSAVLCLGRVGWRLRSTNATNPERRRAAGSDCRSDDVWLWNFYAVFYGIFGFVFGVISAAIYNLIARWIGGIEVEVE
jgi:hypothetical protein